VKKFEKIFKIGLDEMIEECGGKISQRRRDAIKKADWRLNKQDLDQQQDYFSYNNNEEA
jgi:hypothetical protein